MEVIETLWFCGISRPNLCFVNYSVFSIDFSVTRFEFHPVLLNRKVTRAALSLFFSTSVLTCTSRSQIVTACSTF